MKWQEVREQYPDKWTLIEPENPKTVGEQRVFDDMVLLGNFESAEAAWEAYHRIHRVDPSREMFVFHTDRDSLDVRIRQRAALRRMG